MDKTYIGKIKSFIQFPLKYTVFIPQANNYNNILKIIDSHAETYACISDFELYHEIKNNFTKAILGTYMDLVIKPTNYRFSMIYIRGHIASLEFESYTKYLLPDGVLIYETNMYYIYNLAPIISTYYTEINIYKLTGSDVLIFARKKRYYGEVKKETKRLEDLHYNPNAVSELTFSPVPIYNIPPAQSPQRFTGEMDILEIKEHISKSKLYDRLKGENKIDKLKNPIMPLHLSHLGLLLTTGYLDGEFEGHIVKGSVIKTTAKNIEEKNNNEKVITETEQIKVVIKILTKDGEIIEI